ncbi:MAG: glycosyltransferase [Chloroflexota bacterium]
MTHFLLLTKGTGGDLNPFVCLGQQLKQRQHRVTLATHGVYESQVTAAGLDFVALDTAALFRQMMDELPLSQSPSGLIEYFRRYSVARLSAEFERLQPYCQAAETAIVAHSALFFLAKSLSESLHLTCIPILLAPFFAGNILIQEGMHRFLQSEINDCRAQLALPAVQDWKRWLQDGHRFLALWPAWFASGETGWPQHVDLTAFPLDTVAAGKPLPDKVQKFLSEYPDPTLITHGTSALLKGDFLAAGVEACRRQKRPAILLTRHAHQVPARLPAHILWFDALPFEQIMPHVQAVIHHGGVGTTAQAIRAGIPQVIPARGFDRPDNAQRVQALGIGEYLPPLQWTADNIAAAFDRVLQPEVRQRCQAFSRRMEDAPQQIIAETVEQIASSLPPPSSLAAPGLAEPSKHSRPAPSQAHTHRQPDLQRLSHALSPERLALLSRQIAKRNERTNDDPAS